jgi:cell division GTPase FtsZ
VKPTSRALDIVAVGLGQAGGNLAAEFFRRGYRAMALNTAHTDLATLGPGGPTAALPNEQRVYIGIDGYDGAGADLNYGRECITEHADKIREAVATHCTGADLVVLTAGFGGGTGSALSALVETLKDLSLPVVALTTLPHDHESGIAKVNAVRAVNALVKCSMYGWILADNSLLSQAHGDVSLDQYYDRINRVIVAPLDDLNSLNYRQDTRAIRAFDGEDLRTLLLSGGVLNYAVGELPKLTVDGALQAVRESMQYNAIAPRGFSLDRVSYLGLVIEATDEILKETPFSFFEQINQQIKEETGGAAIYMGVYKIAQPKGLPVVWRLVCSSQKLPDGVQEIVSHAQREGNALREKIQQQVPQLDLGDIESLDLFRTHSRPESGRPGSHRPPPPRPMAIDAPIFPSPKPMTSGRPKPPPLSSIGYGESAHAVEAKAAEMTIDIPQGGGEGYSAPVTAPPPATKMTAEVDRDTYFRIAEDYKNANSDEERKKLADRLITDSRSESSLIRYYAVRVMSKLGGDVFTETLQAAAEDEDPTVRSIARKSLKK